MGGADLSDETTKVMRALAGLRTRLEGVDVVIGSQHPARERVRTISRQLSFECHIEPTSMAALMAGADVAIGGAGVTSWERCCLGLPAICISLAHNQVPIAKALEAQGAIVYLGDAATINDADIEVSVAALMARPDRVRGLSSAAHALVDGLGTRRVCEHLLAQP
jgi:spore coat polysaccharide biosynthesis predicted glycosyltransferase SpsG